MQEVQESFSIVATRLRTREGLGSVLTCDQRFEGYSKRGDRGLWLRLASILRPAAEPLLAPLWRHGLYNSCDAQYAQ